MVLMLCGAERERRARGCGGFGASWQPPSSASPATSRTAPCSGSGARVASSRPDQFPFPSLPGFTPSFPAPVRGVRGGGGGHLRGRRRLLRAQRLPHGPRPARDGGLPGGGPQSPPLPPPGSRPPTYTCLCLLSRHPASGQSCELRDGAKGTCAAFGLCCSSGGVASFCRCNAMSGLRWVRGVGFLCRLRLHPSSSAQSSVTPPTLLPPPYCEQRWNKWNFDTRAQGNDEPYHGFTSKRSCQQAKCQDKPHADNSGFRNMETFDSRQYEAFAW